MFRRIVQTVAVVLLALAPSVQRVPGPPMFHGPKSRLRRELNLGWRMELPFPDPFPEVVRKHVEAMRAAGYFTDLASNDLFHGHLLMKPEAVDEYDEIGALIGDTSLFLYHTAEDSGRWDRERVRGIPAERRNPRSIVGFWDGTVRPAIILVGNGRARLQFYESNGTVFDDDIWRSRPDLIQNPWIAGKTIRVGKAVRCRAELQFLILQDPWGRLLLDGRRYDIYLRCDPDREALGLDGYESDARPFYLHDGKP